VLPAKTLENAVMDNLKIEGDSVYRRLGGYDTIAVVIADLFQLMREDPRFGRFGLGRSIDSKSRAEQLTVELICSLAGGPCFYLGRDMRTSHQGLGITAAEWEAFLALTGNVLDKHGIAVPERQQFLELFERYRADIVELPVNPA
jgi:hemoglobin